MVPFKKKSLKKQKEKKMWKVYMSKVKLSSYATKHQYQLD